MEGQYTRGKLHRRTLLLWEMLRGAFAALPISVELPPYEFVDSFEASEALHRAVGEMTEVPADVAAALKKGTLEIQQCLLILTGTQGMGTYIPGVHELWSVHLDRVEAIFKVLDSVGVDLEANPEEE
ncbi:hypothetical protein [Actinomadura litoris]|uniref:hypothetical protein n=1 Tax=Actinomadura litoris TaxID=2678616 RepID=UPI001FA78239|nr:hypothetical protein [Actinomadura litoris]